MKRRLQLPIFTCRTVQMSHRGKFSPIRIIGSAIAVIALLALLPVGMARAASPPISNVHILVHFNLALGQQPENITLEPDGAADMTFATNRQIVRVTLNGTVHLLATVPMPAGGVAPTPIIGAPFLGGIVRTHDGTLYFNYSTGTADLTGIWKLRSGHTPERIVSLPVTSLANGLALDEHTGMLYVADSARGLIWRASMRGGTATIWSSDPALALTSFLGVNGIKVHHDAVWATNTDGKTLLRIPIMDNGNAAPAETRATGLSFIDDFTFIDDSDTVLAALNTVNQLALIQPDGTHTIVLTAADGLSNPTSVGIRGETIYVPSAAYTGTDPNLLLAHLQR